jgi:hypothetical protein
MVDALDRARHYLRPSGYLIDVHPTPDPAHLEVGPSAAAADDPVDVAAVGDVDEWSGPQTRHARADAALAEAVARGWFAVEAQQEFQFRRYADSVSEMREHFRTWKGAVLDEAAWRRAAALGRARPAAQLWLREQVSVARLGLGETQSSVLRP